MQSSTDCSQCRKVYKVKEFIIDTGFKGGFQSFIESLMKKKGQGQEIRAMTTLVNNIEIIFDAANENRARISQRPKLKHKSSGIYKVKYSDCEKRLCSLRWGEHARESKTAKKSKRNNTRE